MFKFIKRIYKAIYTFGYLEFSIAAEKLDELTGAYEYYTRFLNQRNIITERKSWVEESFKIFINDSKLDKYAIFSGKMIKCCPSIKFISEERFINKKEFKAYLNGQIIKNNEFREVRDRFGKYREKVKVNSLEKSIDNMIFLESLREEMLIKEDKITAFIFNIENGFDDITYFKEHVENE